MMQEVAESGHPVFRGTSPKYPKEHLKSKRGGESSVHCNSEPPTAELLLMHIIAVNQHSIHGSVAKWCNRKNPPPVAEPQTVEVARREVSPQLVTRPTTNETLENWALRPDA